MPKEWHDRHTVNTMEDEEKRRFYLSIVADKKPYFMRLIYPALMKQYNAYIKNTTKSALREFSMTVEELAAIPAEERTERQSDFLRYYEKSMPVGLGDCVMNKICRRFEQEFDGYLGKHNAETSFDGSILKSGAEYTWSQQSAIQRLYESYNQRLRNYAVFANYERVDEYESFTKLNDMRDEFEGACDEICSNRVTLCDIVIDICYQKSNTKRFAWEMCGSEIIANLLNKNGGVIHFPVQDDEGAIEFGGRRFSMMEKVIGGNE